MSPSISYAKGAFLLAKKEKSWLGYLLGYARQRRKLLAASVALSVISVTSGLIPYFCIFRLIDLFTLRLLTRQDIALWCGLALCAYAAKVLCFGLSTGLSHTAAYFILENLRLRLADRLLRAPLGDVTVHSIGEIKNAVVEKIENMEPPLAHMIPEGCGHLLLPLASFTALCLIDARAALSSLATLPLSFLCMGLTMKISGRNYDVYNRSNAEMNSAIVEYVEGIEVIKAFGRTGVSYEKFSGAITRYRDFVIQWMSSTWITMKLAFALFPSTLLGVLPVSLALASSGAITAAQAALCVMLAMSMVTSLAQLEVFSNSIKQVQLTVEELQQYLNMAELSEPRANATLKGCGISLRDVRFSYTGKADGEVIHGLSLDLPQGSFTALVGPSGSGKSTLARLISRFWDVSSGAITLGGVDIRDMPLAQLADMVSFVAQDNFLFRCSIRENIRLGRPSATDEEIYAAARAAQCDEFIRRLPQGYDTPAGEAGKRLSGGEKQRIAIARMLLKDAPVIILDEATAFTDPENEDKVQQSIAALTRGKTLLVIAHRLSTIRSADNIVVLDHGRIAAQGTQETLLSTCPLYQRMWQAHVGAQHWAVSARKETAHV